MCSRCDSEGIFAALLLVAIIVVIAIFYATPDMPIKDRFYGAPHQGAGGGGAPHQGAGGGCKALLPIIDRVSDQDIIDKSPPCKTVASSKGMILKPSAAILKEEDYYEFGCNQINLNNLLNATKTDHLAINRQNSANEHNPATVNFVNGINLNEMDDSSLMMPGGGGLSDYLGVPCSFIPSDIPLRISNDIDYYHHGSGHIKDPGMLDNYNEPDHYPLTG